MSLYSNTFYSKYKKNVHSQNGEDGIIEELLKRLNITSGWVCEFGAWNGIYLSNTFNLVEKKFNAVFIEGDSKRYNDLLKTVEQYPNIVPIKAFVDFNNTPNSLDNLLKKLIFQMILIFFQLILIPMIIKFGKVYKNINLKLLLLK